MSDKAGYQYPSRVCHEINEEDRAAYAQGASFINARGYDVLSVQHEYGIFGGQAGEYLLDCLREVKIPVVLTLHTVLRDPDSAQRRVMSELLQLSEKVVVMSEVASKRLLDVHDVKPGKIELVPHGIPRIDGISRQRIRQSLGIRGPMILTFGLLSPDKGLQYMVQAMPAILSECSHATYVVLGATHPNIKANGESYRESLVDQARELGVSEHVQFIDRFVSEEELCDYLGATDYYITPYLNPEQITSGTLAYAMGSGQPVLSTPYAYAEELLDDGRGVLVPFRDPDAISQTIVGLEQDTLAREQLSARAAEYSVQMLWQSVGARYGETFRQAKESSTRLLQALSAPAVPRSQKSLVAPVKWDHMLALSDDTGLLQHATYSVPNRFEGYCVDDNARALVLTSQLDSCGGSSAETDRLQTQALSFVHHSFDQSTGRFRNFMSYDRRWLEDKGSEDSHGRSMWGLGCVISRSRNQGRRHLAREIFDRAALAVSATTSPRTWAYAILGAAEYLTAEPDDVKTEGLVRLLANRLSGLFNVTARGNWAWFEDRLAYANARLSQALMVAGDILKDKRLVETGLDSLHWLARIQTTNDGVFAPIGVRGFGQGETREWFDQQPLEAAGMVSASALAHSLTGDRVWKTEVERSLGWFLGDNMLGIPVFDARTGGCFDGLHEDGVNQNQGAESTLSYLTAAVEYKQFVQEPRHLAVI